MSASHSISHQEAQARKILEEMQRFKVSEDFASFADCPFSVSISQEESKKRSQEENLAIKKYELAVRHKGTGRGAYYATEFIVGHARGLAFEIDRSIPDPVRDLAILAATGCGNCGELSSYALARLLEEKIVPQQMIIVSKTTKALIHSYLRIPVAGGEHIIIDRFFNTVCKEKELFKNEKLLNYLRAYRLGKTDVVRMPLSGIKNVNIITDENIVDIKRRAEKFRKELVKHPKLISNLATYRPFLAFEEAASVEVKSTSVSSPANNVSAHPVVTRAKIEKQKGCFARLFARCSRAKAVAPMPEKLKMT